MPFCCSDKLDEAIKYLTIAILLDPKSANIHATRGKSQTFYKYYKL